MRAAAAVISALVLAPPAAGAQEQRICRFQTVCSGTTPCEAAEPNATLSIRTDGEAAEITIDGETVAARRADTGSSDPESYFAAEPDTGGAMMVSVYADGTGLASLHGDLFGPFAVTMFGTCTEAAE